MLQQWFASERLTGRMIAAMPRRRLPLWLEIAVVITLLALPLYCDTAPPVY